MCVINSTSRGECLGPKQAQLINAQLGLPDKGHAIKWRVVCNVVWLGSMIYGMFLWTNARCVVWSLVVVRMVIQIKYRNTP